MARAGLVAVLCGLSALSCGGVTRNTSPAGDAAGDSGDATVVDAGTEAGSWQKWCEPGAVNNPACPAGEPNGPCSAAGLKCAYPAYDGVALADCASPGGGTAPSWSLTGVICRYDCAAEGDASAATPVGGAACDSRPTLACDLTPYSTKQTTLDDQLRAIAQDCGAGMSGEHIWVGFDSGCATRIAGADSAVATCMAGKLAGERFGCALDRACGLAEFLAAP